MGCCGQKTWNHRSTESIMRMTDKSNYKKNPTKREIERIRNERCQNPASPCRSSREFKLRNSCVLSWSKRFWLHRIVCMTRYWCLAYKKCWYYSSCGAVKDIAKWIRGTRLLKIKWMTISSYSIQRLYSPPSYFAFSSVTKILRVVVTKEKKEKDSILFGKHFSVP